ncbi:MULTISPECIES: hypothetical protein [Bacillus]|uniref:hypothetical protein n=1 Tax=Bacillus TaxID=1386 RepID=UPI000C75F29E|nr:MULTISPECIES: hypothetical protein [Bacillus]MCP1161395.1 hypothetical protein [Bacillus infantis]PLR70490.1 hypothetical protein CYJ37_23440 [Bacillus sp. UMB0728]
MLVQTTYHNGTAVYSAKLEGETIATISLKDGNYPGYSVVPVITGVNGEIKGINFILNWMIARIKSPLISDLKFPILLDYGFGHEGTRLVWKSESMEDEPLVLVQ